MKFYIFATIISIGLVEAYLINNIAVLDKKCNVYFDAPKFDKAYLEHQKWYDSHLKRCREVTAALNLTSTEESDCGSRCLQVVYEFCNSDGSMNATMAATMAKNLYMKFSNGSEYYIKTVSGLFEGCVMETDEQVKTLEGNGTLSECKANKLFEDCIVRLSVQLKNVLPGADWCGTEV